MKNKKTLLLETNSRDLAAAAAIIRRGGLVVFPTETVYGLGANALDERACRGIFAAKGRPQDNPLIVHLADPFDIPSVAGDISPDAAALMEAFMPGPLTLILPKNDTVPPVVTADLPTIGVRVPKDPAAREFLKSASVPVAAPSANLSGEPSPTTFEMAWEAMNGRADAVIRGPDSSVGLESTIVRIGERGAEILRSGIISEKDIRKVLKNIPVYMQSFRDDHSPPPAPGMKYTHYKPRAELKLFSGRIDILPLGEITGVEKIGILSLSGPSPEEDTLGEKLRHGMILRHMKSPEEYAKKLYAEFFILDRLGCGLILAEYPGPEGIGIAIQDRLMKASGGQFL
jgi:L-threonylcarbamoyladenylate synthase